MVAGVCLCEMSDGYESLANTVCTANFVALDGRVIKVKLAGEVQRCLVELPVMQWRRAVIQSGYDDEVPVSG